VLSSSLVGLVGLAASVSLASVACSRTPPEPAPLSSTSGAGYGDKDKPSRPSSVPPPVGTEPAPSAAAVSASAGPGASAAGRCITPTPASAPPIPPPATAAACPPDPEGIPKSPIAQVAFPEAPGNPKVEVEIAKTEHDIQRGLMYRRTMGEEHGMLFHLDERRDHTFWMHNTCMSLDMLFVDDDGMVVGIVEGATPLTDTTRSVGCPSSWVLEVNAGWCRRHGVRAGQKMGIPPAAR
jgi:uncharacterized membrane protein (UPF0127 family)